MGSFWTVKMRKWIWGGQRGIDDHLGWLVSLWGVENAKSRVGDEVVFGVVGAVELNLVELCAFVVDLSFDVDEFGFISLCEMFVEKKMFADVLVAIVLYFPVFLFISGGGNRFGFGVTDGL